MIVLIFVVNDFVVGRGVVVSANDNAIIAEVLCGLFIFILSTKTKTKTKTKTNKKTISCPITTTMT